MSSKWRVKVVLKCSPIFFSKKFWTAKICSIVSCSIDNTENILIIETKIWHVLVRIWFHLKHIIVFFQLRTKTMPVRPLQDKIEWKKKSIGHGARCWGKRTAQSCLISIGNNLQGLHNWLHFLKNRADQWLSGFCFKMKL